MIRASIHAFLALVAVALLFVGLAALDGCVAVKPACSIINALDDVCTVISVPAPDGGVEQVPVSGAELRAFARERAAAHAAAAKTAASTQVDAGDGGR